MFESFQVVLSSVITLFLMMGVGFFFAKKGMLTGQALSQLSRLLLYVVTPSIIIASFEVERTPALDRQLLTAAAGLAGTYALYMLLSSLLFLRRAPEERGILRFASIYGNKGFMGLPLIQAALGGEAIMVAALALAVFNITSWTHGVVLIGGREHLSLKKVICNPAVLGFAAALTLFLTGLRLPGPVDAAVGYLSALNTPLAMVIIGGQMAGTDLAASFRMKKLYAASVIKLLGLPLLTMAVLLPFRPDSMVFLALVILSGCPAAGVTSLFSQMLGKDTALAARLVTLSTLLCIVTLPLISLAAQAVANG